MISFIVNKAKINAANYRKLFIDALKGGTPLALEVKFHCSKTIGGGSQPLAVNGQKLALRRKN